MAMRFRLLVASMLVIVLAGASLFARHRRWPVKVLRDADAERVDMRPVPSSVAHLGALPTPVTWLLGGPVNHRLGPIEYRTFEVAADLKGLKTESDGDYHIVIADRADPSKVMIVEIPAPRENPKLAAEFGQARTAVDEHLGKPERNIRWVQPRKVRVVGVGFFDRLTNDQESPAPNGIELHPVLKITFE